MARLLRLTEVRPHMGKLFSFLGEKDGLTDCLNNLKFYIKEMQ